MVNAYSGDKAQIAKPEAHDYTKYILPVSSFKEERAIISTMFCPVCKTKNECQLVKKTKKVENSYVYDITTVFCNHCKNKIKLKFFVYTDIFNRRNRDYKEVRRILTDDC